MSKIKMRLMTCQSKFDYTCRHTPFSLQYQRYEHWEDAKTGPVTRGYYDYIMLDFNKGTTFLFPLRRFQMLFTNIPYLFNNEIPMLQCCDAQNPNIELTAQPFLVQTKQGMRKSKNLVTLDVDKVRVFINPDTLHAIQSDFSEFLEGGF